MNTPTARLLARRALGAAGLFGAVAMACAQTSQPIAPAQEIATRDIPLTFKTKVNLVSIPAVVRNAQGRAVGGLSSEDFQVFDNGKPQTISRFTVDKIGEAQLDSAPATAPGTVPVPQQASPLPAPLERYVAYVFDDVNIGANELAGVREAAYQHMITSLRPSERAAVYTTSGEGGVDFTADNDKLRQALLAIRPQNPITDQHRCPPMTIYQAEAISKEDVMALAAAMADYLECARGMQGNAGMVGTTLASNAEWHTRNSTRELLQLADRNINTVLANLGGIVKKLSLMAGQRTIVLVSSGFLMPDDRRQDEIAVLERAVRAGVVVNSLDARALQALAPGLDASARSINAGIVLLPQPGAPLSQESGGAAPTVTAAPPSSLSVKLQAAREEALANRDVMAEIAANTGGRFFEKRHAESAGTAASR